MVPILHALPEDLTAEALSNLLISEKYDISQEFDNPYRILVLDKGYFYLKDLRVFDGQRKELKKGIDYMCLAMEKDIAKKTGFPACAVIAITNASVGNTVFVTSRMVGGEYCSVSNAIVEQAASLVAGGVRKIYWRNIKNKPDAFKPSGHLHLLWELYGFTTPTSHLMRMRAAVNIGTKNAFGDIYSKYRLVMDQIENGLTDIEDRLTTHIQDTLDPHQVTKKQIGLEFAYNAPPATKLQAEQPGGGIMNYYATPGRAKESVNVNFTNQLMQHINNFNNPHGITTETINTYTTWEIQQIANKYYNRGETVVNSERFEGRTWDQARAEMRWGIPIYNIVNGIFPWYVFSPTQPNAGEVLMATASSVTSWLPASYIIREWEKQANRIYYTAAKIQWDINGNLNNAAATLNAVAGNWQPNGSMLVFRWFMDWGIGTGNGAITTRVENVGMAVMQNGTWWFPGY